MNDHTVWWLLAGAAVALELLSGTFYLLLLACGLAAGALAAHAGASLPFQLACAATVAAGAVGGWQLLRHRSAAASAMQMDVGQTVHISHWPTDGVAHVRYRGADWQARLVTTDLPQRSGQHRIVDLQGSVLLVVPCDD